LLAEAKELDRSDPLGGFRDRFAIDDRELIYLNGNSLGRMPLAAAERLREAAEDEWACGLSRSWSSRWMELPSRIGAKIARLIGAGEDEVLVADATTVNVYKLALAALSHLSDRSEVVADDSNFPSDVHALEACCRQRGCKLLLAPAHEARGAAPEEIERLLGNRTALLSLAHTAFKSGAVHDMPRLTEAAHRVGALAMWDLSHSVGAVPVNLNGCGADLAVGCCYKYLNGGPGAPAFLFVRRDLQGSLENPIWGWLGSLDPFGFGLGFEAAPGIRRFQVGTPPVLSLAAMEPGVDMILDAGMSRIRGKSTLLSELLRRIWERDLRAHGFDWNSPDDLERRGSHVALKHPEAFRICRALIEIQRVVPDFRAPDNIRFGLSPLSTSFVEVFEATVRLKRVVEGRLYEGISEERTAVT